MLDPLPNDLFVDQPFQTTACKTVLSRGDWITLAEDLSVWLFVLPPANNGIKFRRVDVNGQMSTVIAHASYAEQARLCTRIVNSEGITLETIEHLMATFAEFGAR